MDRALYALVQARTTFYKEAILCVIKKEKKCT